MKISKFKTKKIQEFLKKLPKALVENSFLTFLELLLIALIIGGIVFYQYSILAKKSPAEISEKSFQFQEKTYQQVLKNWQEKEKRFKESDLKEYPNPFTETEEEIPSSVPENTQESPEAVFYIISRGETLWELAEKYLGSGERWGEIKNESGQPFTEGSAQRIPIGQKLIIPQK